MREIFLLMLSAFLLHSNLYSQTGYLVRNKDGIILPSNEWVNSTDDYAERIRRQIKPLIVYVQRETAVTPCEVTVKQSDEGKIEEVEVTQASSDPKWCLAVTKAIEKSEYLPKPSVGKPSKSVLMKFTP